MSRWLVTQNDIQFGVDDLTELKQLAKKGKLASGDMVQPPGATEWLYASEIPELKGLLKEGAADDDDDIESLRPKSGLMGAAVTGMVVIVLLGVIAIGSGAMYYFYQQMPTGQERMVGEGGSLAFSEMVVTHAGAPLRNEPDAASSAATAIQKDAIVQLLAKRGEFYRVRTKEGAEGWVQSDQVLPIYLLGGGAVRDEYDPLYNPDRYMNVRNASWLQLDKRDAQKTVFNFQLQNQSRYVMTDVVLLATIKDSKGNQLEKVEISVSGVIPPGESTMVGTLAGDPKDKTAVAQSITEASFQLLAKEDPDLQLRYRDGVEVEMTAKDFTEANIDLLEIRAVPPT